MRRSRGASGAEFEAGGTGTNALDAELKLPGFDPQTLSQFGIGGRAQYSLVIKSKIRNRELPERVQAWLGTTRSRKWSTTRSTSTATGHIGTTLRQAADVAPTPTRAISISCGGCQPVAPSPSDRHFADLVSASLQAPLISSCDCPDRFNQKFTRRGLANSVSCTRSVTNASPTCDRYPAGWSSGRGSPLKQGRRWRIRRLGPGLCAVQWNLRAPLPPRSTRHGIEIRLRRKRFHPPQYPSGPDSSGGEPQLAATDATRQEAVEDPNFARCDDGVRVGTGGTVCMLN